MTNENETKTKTLKWQLKELPNATELSDLVDSGVITKEEAREILFGSREFDFEKTKALEEQVEFLRDLVTQLTEAVRQKDITIIPYSSPVRYWGTPYWTKTYEALCGSGIKLQADTGTVTTTSGTSESTWAYNSNASYDSNSVNLVMDADSTSHTLNTGSVNLSVSLED